MGISIKQALLFVPNDKNWVSKTLIGGLLLFFPIFAYIFPGIRRLIFSPMNYYMLAIFLMFSVTVFVAICGYFFKSVHNRIVHEKESMPSWNNFAYYLKIGLKAYLGGFVFSLPFIIIFFAIWLSIPMVFCLKTLVLLCTAVCMHIVYSFLYTMFALNFSRKFEISSFWDLKGAWNLIQGNMINFVLLVANCLLVAFAHFLITIILSNAQIFGLLLPFISFYIFMIYTDLFAQFVLNKTETVAE